ncbi:MAG: hypothetical protein ACTSU5_06290 [Promethearchaeota archaeon]
MSKKQGGHPLWIPYVTWRMVNGERRRVRMTPVLRRGRRAERIEIIEKRRGRPTLDVRPAGYTCPVCGAPMVEDIYNGRPVARFCYKCGNIE